MPNPKVFRERARRCRDLLKVVIAPEVIEQLRVWSREFEDEANETEEQLAAAGRALRQSVVR